MVAQGGIGFERGVREIIGRVVLHADPLRHTLRAQTRCCGERGDLVESEFPEGKVRYGVRPFAGEPLAPEAAREAPSDFYAGSEVGFEARMRQANESRVLCEARYFDHPEPEAVLVEVRADPCRGCIALSTTECRGEVLHDGECAILKESRLDGGFRRVRCEGGSWPSRERRV